MNDITNKKDSAIAETAEPAKKKKLTLSDEELASLSDADLAQVGGGGSSWPGTSGK